MDNSFVVDVLKEVLADKERQLKDALQEISTIKSKGIEHDAMIKCLDDQVIDARKMIARL